MAIFAIEATCAQDLPYFFPISLSSAGEGGNAVCCKNTRIPSALGMKKAPVLVLGSVMRSDLVKTYKKEKGP